MREDVLDYLFEAGNMSVSNPFEGRDDVFAVDIVTPSQAQEYLEENKYFPLRLGAPVFCRMQEGELVKFGIGNAHYLAPVSESYFQAVGDAWIPLLDGSEIYVRDCIALAFLGRRREIDSLRFLSVEVHEFGGMQVGRTYTPEMLSEQVIGVLKVEGTLLSGDFIGSLQFYCSGGYLGSIPNVVYGDAPFFESGILESTDPAKEGDGPQNSEEVLYFTQFENGVYVTRGLTAGGIVDLNLDPIPPYLHITWFHLLRKLRGYVSILRDRAIELGVFHYYYSVDGSEESFIQHGLITEKYAPTRVPTLLGDFTAENYEVDIPVDDRDLLWALWRGHIFSCCCIKIRGVPIDSYLDWFCSASDPSMEELLYGRDLEFYASWRKEAKEEIDRIGAKEVEAEVLPYWAASAWLQYNAVEALCMHGLPAYEETSPCVYSLKDKEFEAREKARAKAKWKSRHIELLDSGEMRVKWKSEWELFKLVRDVFEDAQFQYKPEWLKPQSLDIFVPSIRVAIEYQGIEHYQAMRFFGGEEGLQRRRKLDKNKKELCTGNGIELIEWPYTVPISRDNLKKML